MRVVGLDPSLTSFGIAAVGTSRFAPPVVNLCRVRPKLRGHERLQQLVNAVEGVAVHADVVTVEGLSFGAKGSAFLDLAGLHWLIRHTLWRVQVPYAVIPPATRSKWLTGSGNAGKDECLAAAIKRFPMAEVTGNDEADALTLAAMALARYRRPLAEMPKDRAALLTAVNQKTGQPVIDWPLLTRKGTAA